MKRKILVPMFASLMAFSMNVANAHADNIENKKQKQSKEQRNITKEIETI